MQRVARLSAERRRNLDRGMPDGWPLDVTGMSTPERLVALETHAAGVNELLVSLRGLHDTMITATRLFKFWAPIIAAAAISSGFVTGRAGAFISAVLKSTAGQ